MTKKKLSDIDYVKKVIDKIPLDSKKYDQFFQQLNSTKNFSLSGLGLASSFLSNFVSIYDAAVIAKQGDIRKYLIEEGNLFEHLSQEKNKEKAVNLITSFMKQVDNFYRNIDQQELNTMKTNLAIDRGYQFSVWELEENNRKLNALDKDKNQELIKENEEKIRALKERNKSNSYQTAKKYYNELTKDIGFIDLAMIDFYPIIRNLNNEKLLNSIFSQPQYEFKFVKNENTKIEDNQIAIFKNNNGQIFLKSKFGKKQIELKINKDNEVGVSPEFYATLQAGKLEKISSKDLDSLSNFISVNAFPGVTKNAIDKLLSFIPYAGTFVPEAPGKQREMVKGFMELFTQDHVKKDLAPLLNSELLTNILELPYLPPNTKDYIPVIKSLSKDSGKFTNLTKTLLDQDPQFRSFVSDVMEFATTPYYDETQPESEFYKKAMEKLNKAMSSLVETTLNADVISAAIPVINDELIENIFKLPNIDKTLNSKEFLLDSKNKLEKLQNDVSKVVTQTGIAEVAQAANSENNVDGLYDKITTILKVLEEEEEKTTKSKEPSPIVNKVIESIRMIAKNKDACDKLANAFTSNQESMSNALEKVIEHPAAGAALRGFCLSGKEVADFLPKVMNKEGIEAIANYIEKPNTWRLVNIFIKTNTLGFAVSHYFQSLSPWKGKDKSQNELDTKKMDDKLKQYFLNDQSFVKKLENERNRNKNNEKSTQEKK